jgi:hypothetical protein
MSRRRPQSSPMASLNLLQRSCGTARPYAPLQLSAARSKRSDTAIRSVDPYANRTVYESGFTMPVHSEKQLNEYVEQPGKLVVTMCKSTHCRCACTHVATHACRMHAPARVPACPLHAPCHAGAMRAPRGPMHHPRMGCITRTRTRAQALQEVSGNIHRAGGGGWGPLRHPPPPRHTRSPEAATTATQAHARLGGTWADRAGAPAQPPTRPTHPAALPRLFPAGAHG